jgi:hypothetical protein
MAIPVLKLNLAPEPSLWRQNHEAFGWGAVGLGALLLVGTSAYTGWKYLKAGQEARIVAQKLAEAQQVAKEQRQLVAVLQTVDVSTELPRWKLAERILSERSLPWSRLTAELERSLVQDVRVKSIQRTRGTDQTVQLALKGEARSRDAEVKFIERLQGNGVFTQVLLEREAERQGGGLDFELKLPATSTPKAYEPLPEPEASRSPAPARATPPAPAGKAPAPAKTPVVRAASPTADPSRSTTPAPPGPGRVPGVLAPQDRREGARQGLEALRAQQQLRMQRPGSMQADRPLVNSAGNPRREQP